MDYADYIVPIFIRVPIIVLPCEVLSLEKPEDAPNFSPLYLSFALPYTTTIELPLFETSPACDLTNADLDYRVIGDLPSFIEFDAGSRVVTALAQDEELLGKTVRVVIQAHYAKDDVGRNINFAFVFIKLSP